MAAAAEAPLKAGPVSFAELAASPLVDFLDKETPVEFKAGDLWKDKPVYVFVLSHRAEIEKLGYKLVAVVKEELGSKEFVEGWWKPDLPLYLDTEKVFYRLVGGGNVHVGSLEDLQDEGVKSHLESSQKLVEGNLIGEGRVMGGTVIIGKPGQVDFAYLEKKFGDFAAWEDVQAKLKPAA